MTRTGYASGTPAVGTNGGYRMAGNTERTLGALFTRGEAGRVPSGEGASRTYEIADRSGGNCALGGYDRLVLTEVPAGGSIDWSALSADSSGAGYELVQFDTSDGSDPFAVDHFYFVFSGPPEGVSSDEYDKFYYEHMRENLAQESFGEGWRYRVTAARSAAGEGRQPGPHLALYRMDRDWEFTRKSIGAVHAGSLPANWPEWFSRIQFCAVEASALGPVSR